MKILVIAYGYSGSDVSESYSAYQLVQALRTKHQVTVITKDVNNDPDVITIPIASTFGNSQYYRALKFDYFSFMWKAYRLARNIVAKFDIVHHISPISIRYPNILCNLGKPFIWGPVGGGIPYPSEFRSVMKREPLIYRLKILDRLRLFVDPLMINTLARSSVIVVTSSAAASLLPKRYLGKVVVVPEAIEVDKARTVSPNHEVPYVFSSGRLVPYKGMDLLISAFAQKCRHFDVQLWITGDGPENGLLTKLVKSLQIEDRVKLLGRVTRERNYELMAGSLFCVFPALNEAFGHVNLEAMAAGKPIIVTDWGGPADIVVDGVTGFKIYPNNKERFVEELGAKIYKLISDPILRDRMAVNAVNHISERFSWDFVATVYDGIYRKLKD